MQGNSFGTVFRLTTFGESHGSAIGGVIDGCPAGLKLDLDFIHQELQRRRPGQSGLTTARNESDTVEFLSGMYNGLTTGTPIGFIVRNQDHRSGDYNALKDLYRPGHADFTYEKKYGLRDHRGGGRSSARETVSRVVAGAVAKLLLQQSNMIIHAFVKQVGSIVLEKEHHLLDLNSIESNAIRCPDQNTARKMISLIEEVKSKGDTIGGVIQCVIENVPVGIGEPVFNKLNASLAYAMMGINAAKGFELGSGFNSVNFTGSQHNDTFTELEDKTVTRTNNSGGIQGGLSNGMPIVFNVAFKPVSTIMMEQETLTTSGKTTTYTPEGRHDPCVLPRAVPIVESMAALVMADHLLMSRTNRL